MRNDLNVKLLDMNYCVVDIYYGQTSNFKCPISTQYIGSVQVDFFFFLQNNTKFDNVRIIRISKT